MVVNIIMYNIRLEKLLQSHDSLVITARDDTRHDYYIDIANTSGKPNDTVLNNASIAYEDSHEDVNRASPCFMMVFYTADDIAIIRMNDAYRMKGLTLVEEPVTGFITYYSIHDSKEGQSTFLCRSDV
jgi:hypothetical protein